MGKNCGVHPRPNVGAGRGKGRFVRKPAKPLRHPLPFATVLPGIPSFDPLRMDHLLGQFAKREPDRYGLAGVKPLCLGDSDLDHQRCKFEINL